MTLVCIIRGVIKFDLNVYTDVDWGGNIDDRKSTSGGVLFLGKRLVTWTRKK